MLAIIVLVACILIYEVVIKGFKRVDRAKNKRKNEQQLKKFDFKGEQSNE